MIRDPMSWEQNLVNSQVEVNRSVWEMNRPGIPQDEPGHKETPDPHYILEHIADAINQLENAQIKLVEQAPPAKPRTRIRKRMPGQPRKSRQLAFAL